VKDIPIQELLAGLGLTGEAAMRGRDILEEAGITSARKHRISIEKLELARAAIDAHLRRLCHVCMSRVDHSCGVLVQVPAEACPNCGGSSNRRAVDEMVAACTSAGLRRLAVVGGSPNLRQELTTLVADRLELRLVDGTRSPDRSSARRDIAWADVVLVLGATQLTHKVSTLYTRDQEARRKLITTSRRGLEAIAGEVTRSDLVAGRGGRG
jgi:hypothetical protein